MTSCFEDEQSCLPNSSRTMDLHYPDHTIHLSQEIVECIASNLRSKTDIAAARLVNRSFCSAATKLMVDIQSSPSELFTTPTNAEIEEVQRARPFDAHLSRSPLDPVTIWTWLAIPANVPLEDRQTKIGRIFLEHVIAPADDDYLAHLDGQEISGKDQLPLTNGRKATSWGRTKEKAELFCVVTRKLRVFRRTARL